MNKKSLKAVDLFNQIFVFIIYSFNLWFLSCSLSSKPVTFIPFFSFVNVSGELSAQSIICVFCISNDWISLHLPLLQVFISSSRCSFRFSSFSCLSSLLLGSVSLNRTLGLSYFSHLASFVFAENVPPRMITLNTWRSLPERICLC